MEIQSVKSSISDAASAVNDINYMLSIWKYGE